MDNEIMIFNQTNEDIPELDLVKKVLEFGMKKEKLNHTSFNVIIVDNNLPGDMRILGDIYISIDKARSQAIEYGHSFEREICFLAVHGFYHLLGYDHMNEEEEKVMFGKQEEVLSEYGVTR